VHDGVAPQCGVGFHDLELFGGEAPRLEQDAVRDTHLADVVQRRRLEQQLGIGSGQECGEAGMRAQLQRQRLHIVLGAQDVVARFGIAGLGQRGQGQDGDILDRRHLARAALHLQFQKLVLVAQEISRRLEGQLRLDPRQQDRGTDGLGDVVDCADLEPDAFVFLVGPGGHENHRNVGRPPVRLEALAHLVAIHLGHHDVEQDQVGRLRTGRDAQRLLAADSHLHMVGVLEQCADQRQIVRGVVHHQDGRLVGETGQPAHGPPSRSSASMAWRNSWIASWRAGPSRPVSTLSCSPGR